MYTISIYTSIIAGLFVLPDSPQLLFFTLSIYWMVKWVTSPTTFKTKDWIILGLFIGLATLSKVHGLYLWIGFVAFVLFHQIKTLRKANLYFAIVVTILCVLPILYWNVQNDFITYKFHSKRVMHTGLLFDSFFQQILGEVLYQNPLVYISILLSVFHIPTLKKHLNQSQALNLLLWVSLPLIFTFWALSLFNPTLPHWTGPGFIGLFIISGVYWSSKTTSGLPSLLKWATWLLGAFILAFLLLVFVFPRQLGSDKLENLGEYNPINDVTGWETCATEFGKIVARDQQAGTMQSSASIITHKWFPGGHLLFYVARPLQKQVITIGSLEDAHKFAWLNKTQTGLKIGDDAYCIIPSNLPVNTQIMYGAYFETITATDTIPIISRGVLLRNFYVYKLKHCKQLPVAIIHK
jgi:hypothetical protein